MKYFCKVRLESGKDQETTLFLILDAADGEVPELSKAAVIESREDRLFTQNKHTKLVIAEYSVYRTESEITANLENERFDRLIESGAAEVVSSGEMQIDRNEKRDRKTGEIVRKRKKSPVLFLAVAGGVSANSALRQAFIDYGKKYGWEVFIPPFSFTTDNAAMICQAGYFKYLDGDFCAIDEVPFAKTQI